MDFLKKNYEKILLGAVLIGLAGAVVFMLFVISNEKAKLATLTQDVINPKIKPLTNIDLTVAESAIKRVALPAVIDLGPPNRLFNPGTWQKTADGRLVPKESVGPRALTVTNIQPLYFRLTLEKVEPLETGFKYVVGIEDQAAASAAHRSKKTAYCKVNDSTDAFTLTEVRGKPDDPTELVVKLKDSGESVVIKKDKPFERIDGFMADLYHPLETRPWLARRVGASLSFNGEEYKIVAISKSEVVLSATANGKKWTVKSNSASSPSGSAQPSA